MTPPPKCLYETLRVAQSATDAEIKRAYRNLALQHHPDKNRDRPEAAEEAFKHIQHAYSVLSDPHERAWYDGHRAQILRGHDPAADGAAADVSAATHVDIFALFRRAAYNGFAGERGFFSVFGGVFDRLWREEPTDAPAPVFGAADAEWAAVRHFYREWDSFSSAKTFAFADKWNLAEAPNREVRRAMDRENRRERARVKKEFNAIVRELVAFVKKRDPRVVARRQHEMAERERAEEERSRREALRKRERAHENERVRMAREEALEEDAEGLDEILAGIALDERLERKRGRRRQRGGGSDEHGDTDGAGQGAGGEEETEDDSDQDEENSQEEDDLYCVACRKPFRSAAQQADHERSKKHRAAVAKLKRQMLAEDEAFTATANTLHPGEQENVDVVDTSPREEQVSARPAKSKKKRKNRGIQHTLATSEQDSEHASPAEITALPDIHETAPDDEVPSQQVREQQKSERTLSKKEKRRLREARKKANGAVGGQTSNRCNVCGADFPSRNKLMRHVENSGHALHLDRKT